MCVTEDNMADNWTITTTTTYRYQGSDGISRCEVKYENGHWVARAEYGEPGGQHSYTTYRPVSLESAKQEALDLLERMRAISASLGPKVL